MKILNETPSWYILSDSKLNQATYQRYLEENNLSNFESQWIRLNGKAQNVSNIDKSLELILHDFLDIKNDKNLDSKDFLKLNFSNIEPFFDHFTITIAFKNVSHNFVKSILLQKLVNYHINQKTQDNLSLWLPPAAGQEPVVATQYGLLVGDIYESIKKFIVIAQEKNKHALPNEIMTSALAMMPLAQHSKVLFSGSISTWRKLCITQTEFNMEQECRYVFLMLCRDLKMRYFGGFSDLVLESTDKKLFGLDTLKSEDYAWKKYKIISKQSS